MLTPAIVMSIIAILISLLAKYIPPLARWYYDPARDDIRGLIMVGLMALVPTAYYFLAPQFGWEIYTVQQLVLVFVVTLTSNQLTDRVTADSSTQKQIKEETAVG